MAMIIKTVAKTSGLYVPGTVTFHVFNTDIEPVADEGKEAPELG